MLSENPSLEEIAAVFENDRFATQAAGCRVVEGCRGRAVCDMELSDVHRNAMGGVMGGAIFTLADFALAIACNIGESPTVSVDHAISFLRSTKGSKLTATATCDKPGSHLAFYTVVVEDDLGKRIARMTATCYR
ncbi:PaaI family thioesterase [Paraeggerthella hongkongensis]|uniref:PaaI family thioesterase n=1 Tax=Paraeggerthella hongkongensis TaxID=230658 RepID=A0A3N0B6C6_9ACTN|nr:PaaI family thioesterase [Paraeggerthella hongkongensis]RNL42558.1 PaaI family thioesterase [Paraeggerthella hongkongensis]